MSYLWSSQGPAFQYPACYRVENRFLTLRAAMLILAALAVFWVALSDPDPAGTAGAVQLQLRTERGNPVPHVLMAVLMLVLGGIDLLTAARQRRVLLVPGQPASLTSEVARRASGTSSGAAWLMQVMRDGQVPAAEPQGEYAGAVGALAGPLLHAPSSLLAYLRVRVAHLAAGLGLLLALAISWPAAAQPATLALAALLYAALAAALVARSAWIAKDAPSPFALGAALLLALVAGVGIALFGQGVPHLERLKALALSQATLLVLACLLLIEGLGLLAARQQRGGAPRADLQGADASADVDAEPATLMQEVERELHRFWAEGIPNRRHAWEPPAEARGGPAEPAAVVLEESQPMPAADPAPTPATWLLALGLLGLAFTAAGAVLWVQLAYEQMNALPTGSWVTAAPALVLLVAGGYAVRVGHLLWSRVEVDSTLLWLTVQAAPAAAAPDAAARDGLLQLKARVLKARSVFHAAGEHQLGSRVLLQLAGDGPVARRLVQQVQGFAERAPGGAAAAAAAPQAAARPAGATAPARAAAAAAPQRAPAARFCPACGAPQPPGARFCPRCGAAQPGF
ncbi:MAG: zinc ribbon domain-containing protein [Rubrivivax sp.]